jgi:transcriptional regulator with XRE-family HTH domain
MSKDNQKSSEFAEILRRLLDDTDIFDRKEWSEFLGITPSAISQWLHDETMPRPELLRMIVGLVKSSDGVPREVLEAFESMASKPADQVLPPGRRLEGSINAYMVSPLLHGFMRDLQRLRTTDQEKVLLRASEECAVIAGIIRRPPPLLSVSRIPVAEDVDVINYGEPKSINPRPDRFESVDPAALPPSALKAAEAVIASLGEKANVLFDQVIKYLSGSADESLRPIARTFCLYALAHVRTQNNNAPLRVMQHIIRSMPAEINCFTNLQRMPEALNTIFLIDQDTAILVKQEDGDFVSLEHTNDPCDEDIETHVRAISPFEVEQYIPADRLNHSYESVKIDDLRAT